MTLSLAWFQNKYHELQGTTDLWVAYSGGVDSRVLLELCYQYAKNLPNCILQAVHINHGLHKDADAWTAHCLATCKTLNISLHVMPIKLDLTLGESIEALARHARRTIWQELLPANATLLLAHHEQDQAETILHRLFRGAGPTGLAGMHEHCKFGRGILLRPLLTVPKADIEQFASINKLTWIIDSSNHDLKFDRNFIRHAILPELTKRWPKVVNNVVRSGELCNQITTIMDMEAKVLLPNLAGQVVGTLSIKKLLALDEAKCFAILRAWIANNNYDMPSRKQLYRIKDEVMLAQNTVTPKLKFAKYIIRRYRDDLYLLPVHPVIPSQAGNQPVTGKKAKKIFQQHGIPPWQRSQYPLVFAGTELVGIVGLWDSTHPMS